MELFEDGLVVTTLNNAGEPVAAVIDTPLGARGVSGSLALLTFRVCAAKHTADFLPGSCCDETRGGHLRGNVPPDGVRDRQWQDEIRARGVVTKYTSMAQLWPWALVDTTLFASVVFVIATNMSSKPGRAKGQPK